MQEGDLVKSQAQASGIPSSWLDPASHQLLRLRDIFFELFIIFCWRSASVEECPKKEFFEVISSDLLCWRTKEPFAQIFVGVDDGGIALCKQMLSSFPRRGWRVYGSELQVPSVPEVNEDVEACFCNHPKLEREGDMKVERRYQATQNHCQ